MNKSNQKWSVPFWMEKYIDYLIYDKNTIEDLYNDNSTIENNRIRAIMSIEVTSKVNLLIALKQAGLIE